MCTLERLIRGLSRPLVPLVTEVPLEPGIMTRPIIATLVMRNSDNNRDSNGSSGEEEAYFGTVQEVGDHEGMACLL